MKKILNDIGAMIILAIIPVPVYFIMSALLGSATDGDVTRAAVCFTATLTLAFYIIVFFLTHDNSGPTSLCIFFDAAFVFFRRWFRFFYGLRFYSFKTSVCELKDSYASYGCRFVMCVILLLYDIIPLVKTFDVFGIKI